MKNSKRKPQFNFEAEPEFISELKSVASAIKIPAAQIAREATAEKVAELKRTHPKLQNLPAQLVNN